MHKKKESNETKSHDVCKNVIFQTATTITTK